MDVKVDSAVRTVLNALDMEKYIPIFENHGVSIKTFTTLSKDDLRTMGIEENDLDPILKYVTKLGKADPKTISLDLELHDIRAGIRVIAEHLRCIDASLCYTSEDFRPEDWIDGMAVGKTVSEIAAESADHIQDKCEEINVMVDQLLNKSGVKPERKSSKNLMIIVSIAVIAIAVFAFRSYKY